MLKELPNLKKVVNCLAVLNLILLLISNSIFLKKDNIHKLFNGVGENNIIAPKMRNSYGAIKLFPIAF